MGNVWNFIPFQKNQKSIYSFLIFGVGFSSIMLLIKPVSKRLAIYYDSLQQESKVKNRPKRIILIRHGQSMGNAQDVIYGEMPDNKIPLTEKGKAQACDAGLFLKNYIGNEETIKFYISPFRRTKETLDCIKKNFDEKNYKSIEDPRLREQEWGNLQDPKQLQKIENERDHVGKFYYRFPTGESGADVYDRVSLFLTTLFREIDHESNTLRYEKCHYDNIVIVSHGLFIRLFLMRYFKWTVEQFEELENPSNAGVIILEKNSRGKYETQGPLIKKLKKMKIKTEEI